MREIVFDTETTGFNPAEGHKLVEIGCIEMINRVETGRDFHRYINPLRSMPAEAEAVHGLSENFLSDKPLFGDVAADLLEFIGDAPLVAHNANFDFTFLNWELQACGLEPISLTRMVDTLAIARTRHPGAKLSLDALCSRYGIDRSQRIKHGALLDAQLLSQVYVELKGGRQIGLSLAESSAALVDDAAFAAVPIERLFRPARPHRASDAELARHAVFVSTLVEPLWNELTQSA
ncbi:DNA polymerase III subunit epsilon [Sphingomonas sp. AP4-R1]|uniref:DNA polymerase III subunit epsilon n=1 Tax=Sphingomonas sp. AP4-R1 TaxID=2735134 RepID=UPI0014937C26|nr:DNA polymerase III subunit epsilon [Sphingomonas sp. AP4-R1]QJU57223.1 DNA polymerase III subunit epsilon [Sphingomonas sp. AP4-R1]